MAVSWPCRVGAVPVLADCFQHRATAGLLDDAVAGGGTAVLCQVLAGTGGVGKTQQAAAYARAAWQAGSADLVAWATAGSRAAVLAGYAQVLAAVTGTEPGDAEQAAAGLLAWLETAGKRWLIVLDDLADPADVRGLWPPAVAGGRVLVTTRRQDAALTGQDRRLANLAIPSASLPLLSVWRERRAPAGLGRTWASLTFLMTLRLVSG